MNPLELIGGIIGNQLVSAAVGGLTTIVIWKMAGIVWEYFKPLEEVTRFCQKRSYAFGSKTRDFLIKRVADPEFRRLRLSEIERDSERIQDAFVRGIRGELF